MVHIRHHGGHTYEVDAWGNTTRIDPDPNTSTTPAATAAPSEKPFVSGIFPNDPPVQPPSNPRGPGIDDDDYYDAIDPGSLPAAKRGPPTMEPANEPIKKQDTTTKNVNLPLINSPGTTQVENGF